MNSAAKMNSPEAFAAIAALASKMANGETMCVHDYVRAERSFGRDMTLTERIAFRDAWRLKAEPAR